MDNNRVVEDQAALIRDLQSRLNALQNRDVYVGVRNNSKGWQAIPVLGGRPNGEDTILISPGETVPVPANTWEHLLAKKLPNIMNGILTRDDSILGSFGKQQAPDFNEAERAPNALTDERVQEILALKPAQLKQELQKLDALEPINRIIEFALAMDDRPYKAIELVRKRGAELIRVLPEDENCHIDELVRLAYKYDIPRFAPEDFGTDTARMRAFIVEKLTQIEKKMKRAMLQEAEE